MLKKCSTEELLNLYQKDITKNKSRIKKSKIYLIFYFIVRYAIIFLCIGFFIYCIDGLNEYKEVFFTYNAMEQLEDMYKGSFILLYPEINTTEVNITQDRILSL